MDRYHHPNHKNLQDYRNSRCDYCHRWTVDRRFRLSPVGCAGDQDLHRLSSFRQVVWGMNLRKPRRQQLGSPLSSLRLETHPLLDWMLHLSARFSGHWYEAMMYIATGFPAGRPSVSASRMDQRRPNLGAFDDTLSL